MNSLDRDDYMRRYYEFWQRLVSDDDRPRLFTPTTQKAIGGASAFDTFRGVFNGCGFTFDSDEDCVNGSLYFELKTFLHGLLVVEDKLSMAHSLETRVPFLDNDLVDFAVRVPARHKLTDHAPAVPMDENVPGKRLLYAQMRSGKVVLRRAMAQLLPQEVTERTKQGFSAPDASWFRGESIDYINRLLRSPGARIYEFLERDFVIDVLDQHCSGRVNRRLLIWSLLSFEWWCRRFLDHDTSFAA
jgi:asparagine synthase (glutamine-hydrolysing)